MKTPAVLSRPLFFAALGLAAPFAGSAAGEANNVIKFSDPSKPGLVKITVSHGDIRVRGVDVPEVTVKSDARVTPTQRKDGLRVLTSSSSFAFTEKNNVIVIDATAEGWTRNGDFEVNVPRNSSVVVNNSWGGAITCGNLSGDVEIKSMNGRVKLDDVAGGALVETMNGEITAEVREVREGKPLSFTSMNGQITIRVPEPAKANVSLRSQNGSILTDFDEKALITETKTMPRGSSKRPHLSGDSEDIRAAVHDAIQIGMDAAREATEAAREVADAMKQDRDRARDGDDFSMPKFKLKPVPPMTGGKIVSGTLNGGGTEIQATTMNGDVILRKLELKK